MADAGDREAVVPSMRERGSGHVVAISSLAARRGFPGAGGYCATKIAHAIRRGKKVYDFPWQTVLLSRLVPYVPDARLRRKARP